MTAAALFIADIIGSKGLASKPGGHSDIRELAKKMSAFLDRTLRCLNYDRAIVITAESPQGDDVEYRLEAPAAEPGKIADISVFAAISALVSGPSGGSFRYTVYTIEPGCEYHPRSKTFADISKTTRGKMYHLALDRGVVSALTHRDTIAWLKSASHDELSMKLKGEPWTGVYVDLYCRVGQGPFEALPIWKDVELAEKTYLRYRDESVASLDSPQLVQHLEQRYGCQALRIGKKIVPATVAWRNVDRVIHPDAILGDLDKAEPTPLDSSPLLSPSEYAAAREFIRAEYTSGPVKHEGTDYCMTKIALASEPPKIHGRFGRYYDSILTQYAMEWELKKALLDGGPDGVYSILRPGTLPLREAVERLGNPLSTGAGRCTAITVSTLMVFKRSCGKFSCLIRRRSLAVGVSPGMLHVVPAGMFEASNRNDEWSVEMNIWRELLEEVYNEKEQQGSEDAQMPDHILQVEPIRLLRQMIEVRSAELSVSGIVFDLLNLRPEICTVLFVQDASFVEARDMKLNWEYAPELGQGIFAVDWENIDKVLQTDADTYGVVASGAACLALGRQWVRTMHGI